jgi:hypothetical protein
MYHMLRTAQMAEKHGVRTVAAGAEIAPKQATSSRP